MADPPAPQDIARRSFDIARRGYEQQEVRGFLHEVSAIVERLTRSETELRERAERAESRLGTSDEPDETRLLEILGEETTRVLTSARDAAAEIRSKAETAAERMIADATREAAEVRSSAISEADALRAATQAEVEALRVATHAENEALLEAARTELERRAAEGEAAAALIREQGQAQADALRKEGEVALAKASDEAEAALEAARQQGRAMVAEAQAVRERVLHDLAVRRKRARQQVEKLNAGRERLLQAYELVRRTIDEATGELSVALTDARTAANAAARRIEDEPDTTLEELDAEVAAAGLMDLPLVALDPDTDPGQDASQQDDHDDDDGSGPLSGEVPAVGDVPRDVIRIGSSGAPAGSPVPVVAASATMPSQGDERRGRKSRRKKGFEGLPPSELTVVEPPGPDEGVRILASPEDPTVSTDDEPVESTSAVVVDAPTEPVDAPPPIEVPAQGESVEVAVDEPSDAAPEEEPKTAEDVFARLRAESADDAADDASELGQGSDVSKPDATGDDVSDDQPTPADEEGEPTAEVAAFAIRAAAVEPAEKDLGRKLKRALADEQNEVLDLLRRVKPKGVDDLLPAADAHAARWSGAVAAALDEVAAAGAASLGGTVDSVVDLADALARTLTAPLRERIDRSFAASDGNLDDVADRVRALYREWKGQRLTEAAKHGAAAAYARGLFEAIEAGSKVRWVLDPTVDACPDCDDNVLGGAIAKGEEFPTGDVCAPAHPGCHCLVLADPG